MCCVAEIMKSAETWVSFNADVFFKVQKQIGQAPYVCGGLVGSRLVADPRADCLSRWASLYDPDGRQRAAYAMVCWNSRLPHQTVVLLG